MVHGHPAENLNGVYSANECLTRNNLMKAFEFPNADTPIKRHKNVAVVGGGNVAMDSVRTALRLGADNAYIVYRRGMEELPARKEEVEHAGHEGVQFKKMISLLALTTPDMQFTKRCSIVIQLPFKTMALLDET